MLNPPVSVEMDLGLRYTKQDNPSFLQETDLIYLLTLIKDGMSLWGKWDRDFVSIAI
jgi:hypothetical protein